MRYQSVLIAIAAVALGATAGTAEAAKAPKASAHHASAKGKTCKKEFMYWKGGKCMDARKASA